MLFRSLLVRGANGYGNMVLYREGGSVLQWLHVSKYPPSLSYVSLELGIMALCLAAFFRAARAGAFRDRGILLVLGRVPMFFYLLHIPLLVGAGKVLGLSHRLGVGSAYGFGALAVLALYFPCVLYGRYKAAHPAGLARFL